MSASTLSLEIRRLREQSGLTLRGLGAQVGVSASHLSDIEHNRRRPSEKLLRALAHELRASGATFDGLEEHLTGIDAKTLAWASITPGVRMLFRAARESGLRPLVLLHALRRAIGRLRGHGGQSGGKQ